MCKLDVTQESLNYEAGIPRCVANTRCTQRPFLQWAVKAFPAKIFRCQEFVYLREPECDVPVPGIFHFLEVSEKNGTGKSLGKI